MRLCSLRSRCNVGLTRRSLLFEPLESRQLLVATPLITEFMAANDGVLVDEDGDNSDWIELANTGDATADLTGWFLTDNASNLTKWELPAVSLAPGAYLVVFASNKNRADAGMELHTNFALGSGGEYLGLIQPDGTTIASQYAPEYPEQRTNISYGMRTVAGVVHPGDLRFFSPATPGAANDEGYLGITATPVLSVPHGFYNNVQNVSISSPTPGAEIRYTTNGSTPTASTGTVYTSPLAVDSITVLRTAAFVPGYLPSSVETQTYLFVNDVATFVPQAPESLPGPPAFVGTPPPPPAGYPADWGTAPAFPIFGLPPFFTPADYAVDPNVVNNPAYAAEFIAGLTAIPSVSVVMNIDDLFGAAGIYSHPWERGDLWERATSVELFNPDGSSGFQVDAGIRILGNASRQPILSPKHSLRIEMRSQYGDSELNYPLFGNETVTTFDSFVLRANLSDSWISPQGGQPVLTFAGTQGRPRAQYARQLRSRFAIGHGPATPQSQYVHVYINGIYWGLHDLIERRDGDFVASHLGGNPEDYDVLQDDVFEDSGLVVEGDTVAWDAMFALANAGLAGDAQYTQIQQYLNIDSFIDYMHLHLYVGSQDWPYNNWTAVRKREPGGTFEFLVWDAEYVLQDPTIDRTGVNDAASPGQLFAGLIHNAEFRLKFADRAQHFMFNGGLLTPAPAATRYLALLNQIEDAVVAESARWGDYRSDVHPILDPPYELSTRDNQWTTEKYRLLTTWFPVRTTNVISQYIAAGLYPDLVAPSFNQYGGLVPFNFQLTMSAQVGDIWYTLDGSDPRLPGGESASPTALLYDGAESITGNTRVNARVWTGTEWSALSSADFIVEVPQVRITELMYHPKGPPPGGAFDKEEFEFIEIQNIGATPLNLQGMRVTTAVNFTFPDVILDPGQFAVIVENQTAFESRYGTGINVLGEYSGKLDNGGELMATFAAFDQPIHNPFAYGDDDWYPSTDGAGHSLVIVDATADLSTWPFKDSWRPSTNLQGSPGAANPEPSSTVVGRHIFYNQSFFDGNDPGIDGASDDAAIAPDKTAYRPEIAFAIRRLTNNNTVDSDPRIFGSSVVWQGRGGIDAGSDDEIFLFDGASTMQLTTNSAPDRFPEISNLGTVWERGSGASQEIIFHDGVGETPLTNNMIFDGNATLSDDRLAWEQGAGNGIEIMSWTGSTAANLSQNGVVDGLPGASGNRVAWTSGSTPNAQIRLFNGSTTLPPLATSRFALENPQTSSQWVVWEGFPGVAPTANDREIFLYDGTTVTRLTTNTFPDFAPQVSGQNAVWWGGTFNNFHIYRFDGSAVTQLSTGIRNRFPRIDGQNIVWQGYDGNDDEIYFWNGHEVIQLTDNSYNDMSPQVAGNHVVWQGQLGTDGTSLEIFDAVVGDAPANFANVTSYSRGINGIMVDLSATGGSHASITASDFIFKVGNDNSPDGWAAAPSPNAVSVRIGAGVSESDRVEITWAAGAIRNQWLEVQVLATVNTGLAATDVFFWGNRIADSGTSTPVTIFDTNVAHAAQVFATLTGAALITNLRDYDRSGDVTTTDAAIVFANLGSIQRLHVGASDPLTPESGEGGALPAANNSDAGIAFAHCCLEGNGQIIQRRVW